jgi:hypothetical protein
MRDRLVGAFLVALVLTTVLGWVNLLGARIFWFVGAGVVVAGAAAAAVWYGARHFADTIPPWSPRNPRAWAWAWKPARPQGQRRAHPQPQAPPPLKLDQPAARQVPAAHAHGRRLALRAGREHPSQGVMQPILVRPVAKGARATTRSSPASAASAPPPGRAERGAGAGEGGGRRSRRRDGADREHPARRPQPAGRGAGPAAPGRASSSSRTNRRRRPWAGRAAPPATCCAC